MFAVTVRTGKAYKLWDKAVDVLASFFRQQTLMRIHALNILVRLELQGLGAYDFTTPIGSKCGSICYRLAVI